MGGKAQELGILQDATAGGAVILEDDGLELVEEQLPGHAAEEREAGFEPGHEGAHRLAGVELDWGLVARRGLQADDRLRLGARDIGTAGGDCAATAAGRAAHAARFTKISRLVATVA